MAPRRCCTRMMTSRHVARRADPWVGPPAPSSGRAGAGAEVQEAAAWACMPAA